MGKEWRNAWALLGVGFLIIIVGAYFLFTTPAKDYAENESGVLQE